MFFQLGTRQYNGLKSFISFSEESEAIVVEYALIGRKPRLEGVANSLNTITVSFFFHKDFCNVKEEIDALKKSKTDYEILPLFNGSGEHYGDYIITSISTDHAQMDDSGNTTAADVSITLKENVQEDKQKQLQQTAAKNAIATGNKQPVTKSKRTNPSSCDTRVAKYVQQICSYNSSVQTYVSAYNGFADMTTVCNQLKSMYGVTRQFSNDIDAGNCGCLANAAATQEDCNLAGNNALELSGYLMQGALMLVTAKASANQLNIYVNALKTTCSANIKKSIVSK